MTTESLRLRDAAARLERQAADRSQAVFAGRSPFFNFAASLSAQHGATLLYDRAARIEEDAARMDRLGVRDGSETHS